MPTALSQLASALKPAGVLASALLAAGCTGAAGWGHWLLRWRGWAPVRLGAVAVALGTLSAALALGLIQIPLQAAAARWMARLAPSGSLAWVGLFPVALSGLVQEPTKLLSLLTVTRLAALLRAPDPLLRAGKTPFATVTPGLLAGAGFGAWQASVFLSSAFSALSTHQELGPSTIAIPVMERALMGLFHVCSTGILAWVWARAPSTRVTALATLILLHGLLNYLAMLYGAGIIRIWWAESLAAGICLALLAFLRTILRACSGGPAQGENVGPEGNRRPVANSHRVTAG